MANTEYYCSICDSEKIRYLGEKDFNYSCNDYWTGKSTFPASGNNVKYYQCDDCRFIFTPAFDEWDAEQFKTHIYNSEYLLTDPEFDGTRAIQNALLIDKFLQRDKENTSILDIGGGKGEFAKELTNKGYKADTHDKLYNPETEVEEKYNFLTSFEVVEHVPHKQQLTWFAEAAGKMVKDNSSRFFFGTDLSFPDTDIKWHYIAPRNGHISFHSPYSLQLAAGKAGMKIISLSSMWHVGVWDENRK